MAKVKVELNEQVIRRWLKSDDMMNMCEFYAKGVQQTAGEGYEVSTYRGKTRANASVYTDSYQAIIDNYENNTLLKGLK